MKIYPECYNCFITQAIRSSSMHTTDKRKILDVVQRVVKVLVGIDHSVPPPLISENVYDAIKSELGVDDPYEEIKKRYNDIASGHVKYAKKRIFLSNKPLECALKISLAGNIIDFGSEIKRFDIEGTVKETIENGFNIDDTDIFKEKLENAKKLVLLADNAGEAVFDRILLETIKKLYKNIEVYTFVREGPIINDVTLKDAHYIGMDSVSKIVTTGRPIPGFWPDYCNDECKKIWESADIVISKGQGNFETLTEFKDERIFFLFIVKCRVVADYLHTAKYSKVFLNNGKIKNSGG